MKATLKKNRRADVEKAVSDAVELALTRMVMVAEGYSKAICPVDTGRLRASISYGVDAPNRVGYIGTNVEYAPYVELGTSRQKAQPYLRPAIANHIDEYRNIAQDVLKNLWY